MLDVISKKYKRFLKAEIIQEEPYLLYRVFDPFCKSDISVVNEEQFKKKYRITTPPTIRQIIDGVSLTNDDLTEFGDGYAKAITNIIRAFDIYDI